MLTYEQAKQLLSKNLKDMTEYEKSLLPLAIKIVSNFTRMG